MNSGFAKFVSSFGYDPFSKPQNLTWLEAPVDITGPITNMPLAGKVRYESNAQHIYVIDQGKGLYQIQPNSATNPNLDSVIGVGSVAAGGISYMFGASMDFFANSSVASVQGSSAKLYVAGDQQINSINVDQSFGTAETIMVNNHIYPNSYHPLRQFLGKIFFGNGNTIGSIDSTGTTTSSIVGTGINSSGLYSDLNPPLGIDTRIQDLDVSPAGDYLSITASNVPNERLDNTGNDGQIAAGTDGALYKWNGIDNAVTAVTSIPSYSVSALQTYLSNNYFFSNDSFGSSLNDGVNKILTLTNNKSPQPNATAVNGNFMTWICPEVSSGGTARYASLYYFGGLDNENPPGLFRVMRYTTTLSNGFVFQTPMNVFTNNSYMTVNSAATAIINLGYGKHYLSVNSASSGGLQYKLLRFLITSTGTGTPQLGVYETQTQLFANRVTIKQIRVYTEPTASNNGFQIDCIGSDGNVVTNGTFNYTYAAGTDITKLQGSLERINFNPSALNLFALGIRVTNTGTTNMTIKKIEIDWNESGK